MCPPLHAALWGLAVLLLNIPFGYWRVATRELSPEWFLAIHPPVLPVILSRHFTGHGGWEPVLVIPGVALFTAGQWLGGILRQRAGGTR